MEPFVLLELASGPTYGYRLAERMVGWGFGRAGRDPSVVYKVLRGLEDDGIVCSDWALEGEGGPPRRMYRLTTTGRSFLADRATDLRRHQDRTTAFLARYAALPDVVDPADGPRAAGGG